MTRLKIFSPKIPSMLFVAVIMLFSIFSHAQINIGDKVPDKEWSNAFQYAKKTMRFSDFKGKPIILYFWSTNCAPCVAGFPKLDSLQKKYEGVVQIIMVNPDEDEQFIKGFMAKRKKIAYPRIPSLASAKALRDVFYIYGSGSTIWIDTAHIFRYGITSGYLSDRYVKPFAMGLDPGLVNQPKKTSTHNLLESLSGDNIAYSSTIAHYKRNVKLVNYNSSKLDEITPAVSTIVMLYQRAYEGINNMPTRDNSIFAKPGRTVLEMKDAARYVLPSQRPLPDHWEEDNAYYYQLLVPKGTKTRAEQYLMMLQDLERCFPLQSQIEKRKVHCLVLQRIDSTDRLKTKGGAFKRLFFEGRDMMLDTTDKNIREGRNVPFKMLVDNLSFLSEKNLGLSLLDETGYTSKIDMDLKVSVQTKFNLAEARQELQRYGLDLIETDRELDVLVLKDKK